MLSEQQKNEWRQQIQSNTHEVYVVSFEEMDAIIKSSPKGTRKSVQDAWKKINGKAGFGASYYASADDAVTAAKLIADLGGVGARAYIKSYSGKPHIIIKGSPGLRRVLTGTKYGIRNPKVISMGLGRAGALSKVTQGGILTVVLVTVYRVADFFLTDEATLSQLVGRLATDIVKVGIVTGASLVAVAVVCGLTTVAIGPIVAVVFVGLTLSPLLSLADEKLGITDRVIAGLDELGEDAEQYLAQRRREALNAAGKAVHQVIDYAVETARAVAIIWIQEALRDHLSPLPRAK